MQTIARFVGPHAFLSNFHPAKVRWAGTVFATVEHAYQAAKTKSAIHRLAIQQAESPGKAKQLGRRAPLRDGWDILRVNIMRDLLRRKFKPGSLLAAKLLATGSAQLVEGNHWGDYYWGVCRGTGSNMLGKLLMEVRAELKAIRRPVRD